MKLNHKYLVTTSGWFYAPDGEQYNCVFGTVTHVTNAEEELGIKTNRSSTNWYINIGNMIIAGCQIQYLIKTDKCSFKPPTREITYEGKLFNDKCLVSRIYNADLTYTHH